MSKLRGLILSCCLLSFCFYFTAEVQTLLVQRPSIEDEAKGGGVAARHGLPVAQRPPQFDYFYRANDKSKQRADEAAAAIGRDIQKLVDQRREREAKQSELWCKIALRGVARLDLSRKPLYRFELKIGGDDAA